MYGDRHSPSTVDAEKAEVPQQGMAHQCDATTTWGRAEEGNLLVSLLEGLAVFLGGSSGSLGDMGEMLIQGSEASAPVQVWLYIVVSPNFETQLVVGRE